MSVSDMHAFVESFDDSTALDFQDIIANFSTETLAMANEVLAPLSATNDIYINRTVKEHCMRLLETYNRQQKQEEATQHHLLTDNANFYALQKELRNPTDHIVANLTCPPFFDTVLCWPATPAGTTAKQPCFAEFKGVLYNTTENVTRHCAANGVWDNYSDYMKCQPSIYFPDISPTVELSSYIYFFGYFLSLTSLILALIVFYFFKDLKCLRNTIHANLFLTYILAALLWILTMCLHVMTEHPSEAGCIILVMMFHYFNLTNFFWMFVEGLYLYTLVVQTFSRDNIRFGIYTAIGWGCPAGIIFLWSIAKIFATSLETEHFNGLFIQCSWLRESHIDWIFQGPTCVVLILNLIFLIRIMWVLITKLRSANTLETRQYRKASKALLVLIPLFGITYLIVLFSPGGDGITQNVFENLRVVLISTQGFFVSLLFCFLNSEVRQALRHRFLRWRDNRNLGNGNRSRSQGEFTQGSFGRIHVKNYTNTLRANDSMDLQQTHRFDVMPQHRLVYRVSKDDSHRSRTESLRLTSSSPVPNGFSHA